MYAQMLAPGHVAEFHSSSLDGVEVMYSDSYVAERIRQRNLYGYCEGNPTNCLDPSGLRHFTFRIYYYFTTIRLTPVMEAEAERIIMQCINAKASSKHTVSVVFVPLPSKSAFDAIEFGWVLGGYFHSCPAAVDLGVEDTYKGPNPGQGANFKGNLNPSVILSEARRARVSYGKAVGTVIVHEAVHHGIVTLRHYHQKGFVDASSAKVGGNLSNESCTKLVDKCDLE